MTTIAIPVTKTERTLIEKRAKRFGYPLEQFSVLALKGFSPVPKRSVRRHRAITPTLDRDDEGEYKPEFIARIKALKLQQPSTKDTTTILKEMKATGLYKPAFLKSLAAGLKDSAYFKS